MDGIAAKDLYERDFYAWTQDQAARLRAMAPRNDGVDVENLAEEVESLGRSDRRAAGSLIGNIIVHLLKMRFHPAQQYRAHWRSEVRAFRNQLEAILDDSPSLRAQRAQIAASFWRRAAQEFLDRLEADGGDPGAVRAAIDDMKLPYLDLDAEVLNEDWFPDPPRLTTAALETTPPLAYSPRMDGIAAKELYERDFHAWTQDQAARLRALAPRNDGVDIPNIAEEIESLGRSQRAAVRSLMAQIVEHLLKLRFHPHLDSRRHWKAEVRAFRRKLLLEFRDSPSLRARRHEIAAEIWGIAARDFLDRLDVAGHDPRPMRRAIGDLDQPCFDLDAEVLNEDWFPDPPA